MSIFCSCRALQFSALIVKALCVIAIPLCVLAADDGPEKERQRKNLDLCKAANTGNLARVKDLIAAGVDIEAGETEVTPLSTAVLQQREEVVAFLLSKGASTKPRMGGVSLLGLASVKGSVKIVEMLLKHGMDVNEQDEDGITALHKAKNKAIVDLLISKGATLELKSEAGWTALHYAASEGRLEVVKALIEKGAKIDVTDKKGQTPTDLAKDESIKAALRK